MSSRVDEAVEAEVPSREELVERANALRGQLWEDAAEVDTQRDLVKRDIDAITEAGLTQLMVPKRLGGYETDATTFLEVTAAVGRGCSSAAWVTGILNAGAFTVGLFPDQAREDVWGSDPTARVCSVIAPTAEYKTVDGGLAVSGRWAYGSGSLHSEWACVSVPMSFGPAGPEFSMVLMPMSDLSIEDTWYVAGMRGSGSNTVVADEVFVPEYRIMPLGPAMAQGVSLNEHHDETLYKSSMMGILVIAIIGPQIGLLDAALDEVLERSRGRMIVGTSCTDQSQSVAFQMDVAEAASKIDAARLLVRRAAADIDAHAATGELPPNVVRGRIRSDCAWASQQLHQAMEILMSAHGTSGFSDASPLQRLWRDISIASRHAAFNYAPAKELYGKVLLGMEQDVSFLF